MSFWEKISKAKLAFISVFAFSLIVGFFVAVLRNTFVDKAHQTSDAVLMGVLGIIGTIAASISNSSNKENKSINKKP